MIKLSRFDNSDIDLYHPGLEVHEVTNSLNGLRTLQIFNSPESSEIFNFSATIYPDLHRATIDYVGVKPEMRNKKVATSLVDWFEDACRKYHISQIDGMAVPAAIDFWRKKGFGIKDGEYGQDLYKNFQ